MSRQAKEEPKIQDLWNRPIELGTRSGSRETIEILFYGLILLIFFKTFSFQNFQIPTPSMENTLLIGDHITANTFVFKPAMAWEKKLLPFRDIKRADVIVFKWPGDERQDWIKRCIGIPGDRLYIVKDRIYLNHEVLEEMYPFCKERGNPDESDRDPSIDFRPKGYFEDKPGIEHAAFLPDDNLSMPEIIEKTKMMLHRFENLSPKTFATMLARLQSAEDEHVIPEGFYFMMGDNRNKSYDSREWGLVPREFIQGRAYCIWWSYGEDEGSHMKKGWDLIYSYLRVPFTFWTRTHWDKTFTLIK